jgi:YtfJ family uncharacterized protein
MLRMIVLFLLLPSLGKAQPEVGKSLPVVEIKGKEGGLVAGGDWTSSRIRGKVITLMYVDPDEKEVNEHVEQALKREDFPRDKYGSVAVINTAATWKPDSAIKMVLKRKQNEFPDTEYVMDRRKVLVERWGLADDAYHVLTFGKDGRLLFQKAGRLSESDIQKLIRIIRENM